jgi:hypothetical protein
LPGGYREQKPTHRHPVALAVIAHHHADACVAGDRQGYRTIRGELLDRLPSHEVDAVLEACQVEGSKLVATARAVSLVERARRGEIFVAHL